MTQLDNPDCLVIDEQLNKRKPEKIRGISFPNNGVTVRLDFRNYKTSHYPIHTTSSFMLFDHHYQL